LHVLDKDTLLILGQLLRGFSGIDQAALINANDNEFFVPSTRNETIMAMNRLFRLFSSSNRFQSAKDNARHQEDFRIGFFPDAKTGSIKALLFTVNMNVTFNSFAVQDNYYHRLQTYFNKRLEQLRLVEGTHGHVYRQVKHG
jgi:hypothetical protein